MDRHALRLALAMVAMVAMFATLTALAMFAARPTNAQPLPTLHVRSFVLAADKTSVAVGEAFHLTLTAHIDEKLSALENVVLPNLATLEDLGDERRCSASKRGTDCVETLTLDATDPGDRTIGPATLEAVDPQTGRPHSFTSNVVTIHVTGQAKTSNESPPTNVFTDALATLVKEVVVFVLVAAAFWTFIWGVRSRLPRRPPPIPVVPVAPVAPQPTPVLDWAAQIAQLTKALENEPTRARAIAVREALRRYLGARDEETLADLVARNAANGQPKTLAALAAVERAAFCEEPRVPEAAREALPYLKS